MEKRSKDILFNIISGVFCTLIGFYSINFTFNSSRIRKLERELLSRESNEWPLRINYSRKIYLYNMKRINPFYSDNTYKN